MPALFLDTATERGFVAIAERDQILFSAQLPFGLQNSQFLLPEINKGIKDSGLVISDLSFIAVGVGPGSYTGIRVGATVAKTLAFACNIPLIGVCTLNVFIPEKDGFFAALIDAKIGGVYLQKGNMQQGSVQYVSTPMICSLMDAGDLLKDIEIIVTPNAAQIRSRLEGVCKNCRWIWQERDPSIKQMGAVAWEKFGKKEFSADGHIDLLYLRKTQAELEKQRLDLYRDS